MKRGENYVNRDVQHVHLNAIGVEDDSESRRTSLKIEGPYILTVVGKLEHNTHLDIADRESAIALRDWLNYQINYWDDSRHQPLS